ncbi:MAG: hypothetical protein AAF573_21890 [Bacteroidota bacterium]
MSVLDMKNDLLRMLVETNDPHLLKKLRIYFKNIRNEPLTKEELENQKKRMIDIGLKQIEEGKTLSHEEARKKIQNIHPF